jgi:diguanylate cyclase (GGDEF)-like protein
MGTDLRLLLIEDSEDDASLVVRALMKGGYRVAAERVETREALCAALDRQTWDLAISDHTMPRFTGTAALAILRDRAPDLPFIFVSGTLGEDTAVAALKSGAHDYIMKGNLHRLVPAVDRELREAIVRRARKVAEERLAHLAYHDPLTDLPNRALMHDRLEHAVRLARRGRQQFTLLLMDLDGFKGINDSLGHRTGDRVLQHVATRLRGVLREADTVARLGGDEFALILAFTNVEGARVAARRLLDALTDPLLIDGHSLEIRASIGIVEFPQHGSTAETLLQKADVAMYAAKAEGSGVAIYAQENQGCAPRAAP